jgi:uncharacterized membrane protein YjgN (DUF898 family)
MVTDGLRMSTVSGAGASASRSFGSPAAGHAADRHKRFAFHGSTSEYFGIWIVNLALTVLTVGIYSAWAKVRTRKYFYRNTEFAGERFDYHARPTGILVGRLIAAAMLGTYLAVGNLAPEWGFVPFLAIVLLTPWLLLCGARFNARNSSYRNVRFAFDGSLGESFAAFIGWPVLGVLSLGFAFPIAMHRQARWRIGNHRYGDARFLFGAEPGAYYRIYFVLLALLVAGFSLIMLVFFGGISMIDMPAAAPAESSSMPDPTADADIPPQFLPVLGLIYLLIILLNVSLGAFFAARSLQVGLGRSTLAGAAFGVGVKAREVVWLYVSNIVAVLFSLGLAFPWTRIRTARYQLERLSLEIDESTIQRIVAQREAEVSALGEEVGDAFDVEFDFGL